MDRSWWSLLAKHGPLEKEMAKHFSILALRIPMNDMKRQKYMTPKDESPRSIGFQYASGEQWKNSSRENEEAESKQK